MSRRRSISETERARIFARHGGICHICGQKIDGGREGWDVEHVIPLALGGSDDEEDLRPAHRSCHKPKTATDKGAIAKAERQERRSIGIKRTSRNPLPGSKASGQRKTLDGRVLDRETGRQIWPKC